MASMNKEQSEVAKLWDLPTVDDHIAQDDGQTNAFNKPRNNWKYEAPEAEDEVQALTAEDIENIRQSAYQEGLLSGHNEGFKKGESEGFEAGEKAGIEAGKEAGLKQGLEESSSQIKAQIDAFKAIIENLQEPINLINDEVKKELVILSTTIAKTIVNIECQQNSEVILQALNSGLKTLPINQASYQIYLHQEDFAILKEHFEDIDKQNWQLIEDNNLARGGCTIQCTSNAVDISIEKRSQEIITPILLNHGLSDDPRAS